MRDFFHDAAANTWYRFALHVVKGAGTGTVEGRLYTDGGSLLEAETCTNQDTGSAAITNWWFGDVYSVSTADITIDDVDIHRGNDEPGNVRVAVGVPTSVSSCTWAPTGCASDSQWDCLDEPPPSDGNTTQLRSVSVTSCMFGHTAAANMNPPVGGNIHSADAWYNVKAGNTAGFFARIDNRDRSGFNVGTSYSNYFDREPTDPDTNGPWTVANSTPPHGACTIRPASKSTGRRSD